MTIKKISFAAIALSSTLFFGSCNSKTDDATLKTDVTNAVANPNVSVSVNDGVVTLAGTCEDDNCKTNSENAAKNVKNVKSVVNNITIAPAVVEAPVTISGDDALKSSADSVLKSYNGITADVNDGVITLRGNIARSKLQKLIISLNELHPKKIDNQLVIK